MTKDSDEQGAAGKKLPWFERFAHAATAGSGSSPAFGLALATIIVWLISGPLFHFSDTWQLVINTGTTIVTFLMVFLIQRSQNKDSLAIQLKLNELVAAVEGASNHLIGAEDFSEEELQVLRRHYAKLAAMSRQEADVGSSLSLEEAKARHEHKRRRRHAQKKA
jgi:low affinity Fe/Cu permease